MAEQDSLQSKIEGWVAEGLISAKQGEALKQRETKGATASVPERRVKADEVLVYLGSLVVFLAIAFVVRGNWTALGAAGRILSVAIATAAMLALGSRLRVSENARHRRGAQALWLSGCLLSAFCFGVTFKELDVFTSDSLMVLTSCVLGACVAGIAFARLTSIAQSIALHLCGTSALVSFLAWFGETVLDPSQLNDFHRNLLVFVVCLVAGGTWLALSEWARTRQRKELVVVSRLFGALTILVSALVLTMEMEGSAGSWHRLTMEAISFVACVVFIAASVKRQSQVFLYSGSAFLLFWVIYVNFTHFEEKVGMPIVLLIVGAVLIGLGLGAGRLSKRIRGG